jgi:hypothetical protein
MARPQSKRSLPSTGSVSGKKPRKTDRQMRKDKKEKKDRTDAAELLARGFGEEGDVSEDTVVDNCSVTCDTGAPAVGIVTPTGKTDDSETAEQSLKKQLVLSGAMMGVKDYEALGKRRVKEIIFRVHKFPFQRKVTGTRMKEALRKSMGVDDKDFFHDALWDHIKKEVKKTVRTKRSSVVESIQKMVIGKQ